MALNDVALRQAEINILKRATTASPGAINTDRTGVKRFTSWLFYLNGRSSESTKNV